jgi:hypothetical protein
MQSDTSFLRPEDEADGALSVELTTPLGFGRNAGEFLLLAF